MQTHKPTCYLVGQDNLLIECGTILLSKSFLIKGIISSSHDALAWAHNREIDFFRSLSDVKWEENSADYLFSIVNNEIIPDSVLQHIHGLAINYHDAPLPRYAGSNVTSWALLNNEPTHGITWHVINDRIDAGDILKQVSIPISPDETALSLNMKCIERAIISFRDLVGELCNSSYKRLPQNLLQRTYFARSKKPAGNGWINWQSPAEEIERLWRATQFGNYRNPFTVLKVILDDTAFTLSTVTVLSEASISPPGTILELNPGFWKVSTKTNNILLKEMKTAQGICVELATLVNQHQITVGTQLPSPNDIDYEQFLTLSQQCFAEEARWIEDLKQVESTAITSQKNEVNLPELIKLLPESLYYRFIDIAQGAAKLPVVFLTAWLIYLQRLGNQSQLGVYIQLPDFLTPT
ncbi:MAG: tycC, partial [Gammaproteobacteria bacterium]|nr:tycC [Gammaproteobacteria bacterium]